ncbi:hypothetical protein PAPYR_10854 [Paratrimastix pyriformis]|uniref:DUF913 domain-containing protein n=1 Tax=Paratrimastix pyriformis TaxID=342808 RepID=A0ABQ8U504_9EUKA|nr:hypothetical protein PAPYR_10854 [Paratrimastix pyriformis]
MALPTPPTLNEEPPPPIRELLSQFAAVCDVAALETQLSALVDWPFDKVDVNWFTPLLQGLHCVIQTYVCQNPHLFTVVDPMTPKPVVIKPDSPVISAQLVQKICRCITNVIAHAKVQPRLSLNWFVCLLLDEQIEVAEAAMRLFLVAPLTVSSAKHPFTRDSLLSLCGLLAEGWGLETERLDMLAAVAAHQQLPAAGGTLKLQVSLAEVIEILHTLGAPRCVSKAGRTQAPPTAPTLIELPEVPRFVGESLAHMTSLLVQKYGVPPSQWTALRLRLLRARCFGDPTTRRQYVAIRLAALQSIRTAALMTLGRLYLGGAASPNSHNHLHAHLAALELHMPHGIFIGTVLEPAVQALTRHVPDYLLPAVSGVPPATDDSVAATPTATATTSLGPTPPLTPDHRADLESCHAALWLLAGCLGGDPVSAQAGDREVLERCWHRTLSPGMRAALGTSLTSGGLVVPLLGLVRDRHPAHMELADLAIRLLHLFSRGQGALPLELGLVDEVAGRLWAEVEACPPCPAPIIASTPATEGPVLAEEIKVATPPPGHPSLPAMQTHLRLIRDALFFISSAATDHHRLGALVQPGRPLVRALTRILAEPAWFGGTVFSLASRVLNSIGQAQPTLLPRLHEAGLVAAFMEAFGNPLPATALPRLFDTVAAFLLHHDLQAFVTSRPVVPALLRYFVSPGYGRIPGPIAAQAAGLMQQNVCRLGVELGC